MRDDEKNNLLRSTRWFWFEDMVECMAQWWLLAIAPHHKPEKYPNQKKFIIHYREYIYYVPFIKEWDVYVLKTIIPSRKLTKEFISWLKNG